MTTISVIVPTFNRKHILRRALKALSQQTHDDYEVIVVDDGSTDGTADMVSAEFPAVRFVRTAANRGPAAARNDGIAVARGKIIAFTDDDCVAPPDWLARHLAFYADPEVGAVGGPQLPSQPNLYDKFELCHYKDEVWVGPNTQPKRMRKLPEWGGLATSNMSVRRTVFDAVGLFDEAFLTGADPELIQRANRAGFVIVQDPSLQVEHLKVHSLRSYLKMRFRRGCGSVLADRKQGTLQLRRFLPLPNLPLALADWQNLQAMYQADWQTALGYWLLVFLARWAEVAGRIYYYLQTREFNSPAPIERSEKVLDIGCGQAKTPGALGLDFNPHTDADVLADAAHYPWPFADNSFDRIVGNHVVEHVPDLVRFFQEVHRVARPGARIQLVTPHFSNRYSFTDPTHLHHLAWRSFDYFTGESRAPVPSLSERALEIRHPIPAFYTHPLFRRRRTWLDFGRPFRWLAIDKVANRWPDFYEHYLVFLFPARDLYVDLEVRK